MIFPRNLCFIFTLAELNCNQNTPILHEMFLVNDSAHQLSTYLVAIMVPSVLYTFWAPFY